MSCFIENYKTKITIIYFLNYQHNDNSMYKPKMYAILSPTYVYTNYSN